MAASLSAACGGEGGPASTGPEVRDSAGVSIVENRGSAWADGEGWQIAPEPELALGTLDGPEETRFFQLEPVRLRGDGVVLVPERGRARVTAFDAAGTVLWAQGREGEGPGEYQGLGAIHPLAGDSTLVLDFRARRLSVLGPAGTFVRSTPTPVPEGSFSSSVLGAVAPGRLAMVSRATYSSGEGATNGRLERRQNRLFFATPGGELLTDTLPLLPGSEVWMVASESFVSIAGLPFGRASVSAAGSGRVITGVTERPELRVWTDRGQLERIIRLPLEARPVTEADWEGAIVGRLGDDPDPDDVAQAREFFADIPRPANWPRFMLLLVDDQGYLWLREYDDPGADTDPARWWVMDPNGTLLGALDFPPGFQLDDIRGDRAAGRWTDELGVERVRVYRIQGR